MNHKETALRILSEIKYATVATVTPDGRPWNSPVAAVVDANYNIYWFSDKENQHSVNIRNNSAGFIVIYDSTVPEGDGEGVYIEAELIEMVDEAEINTVRNLKKGNEVNDAANFMGEAVRRCYKAIPKNVWVNDAEEKDGVFIRDYRVKVEL